MRLKLLTPTKVKKRILIVNCYFDETRLGIARNTIVPQPITAAYLAGAFSPNKCHVRLHNEMYSGPLEDENLLAWPDMLVLTGLKHTLDRMLHLTAYAKTKNRKMIVVAGGTAIRALPNLSKRFFDYVCLGDIEELREVIDDAFGLGYSADEVRPRYDLAYWTHHFGYVETSRYCNFKCAFCGLVGEGRNYQKYKLANIRRQIVNIGKHKDLIVFIDNNFYGNDRQFFLDRLELIKELQKKGYIKRWSASVANDFFYRDDNLKLVKDAGCISLFSGLESFDLNWLRSVNKLQNTRISQIEMIRKCLEHGIFFIYGYMLDFSRRYVADMKRELEFILNTPQIPLPRYFSITVPMLKTPYFYDCLDKNLFFPLTKLRDLENTTLSIKSLDLINRVTSFITETQTLRGQKRKILHHCIQFYRRYKSTLPTFQMIIALSNATKICYRFAQYKAPLVSTLRYRNRDRTHLSTTEILDRVYKPAFRIDSRYRNHFKPILLTDELGHITKDLELDVFGGREHLRENVL